MAKSFSAVDIGVLWNTAVPATEYMTQDEVNEIFPVFQDAVEDMRYGVKLDESASFQQFLDYMGLAERDFGWEDFREWYDSL